jgi:hypothetical protein
MGEKKAKVASVKCVIILPPPLIYIGVAPGIYGRENRRGLLEPPLGANEEAPRVGVKLVVPWLVRPNHLVQPNHIGHQPTPSSRRRLAGGPSSAW